MRLEMKKIINPIFKFILSSLLMSMIISVYNCSSSGDKPGSSKPSLVNYEKPKGWWGIGKISNEKGKVTFEIKGSEAFDGDNNRIAYFQGNDIFNDDGKKIGSYYEETATYYDANGQVIAVKLGNTLVDRRTSKTIGTAKNQAHLTEMVLQLLK
jgi:hypothetical protein